MTKKEDKGICPYRCLAFAIIIEAYINYRETSNKKELELSSKLLFTEDGPYYWMCEELGQHPKYLLRRLRRAYDNGTIGDIYEHLCR